MSDGLKLECSETRIKSLETTGTGSETKDEDKGAQLEDKEKEKQRTC